MGGKSTSIFFPSVIRFRFLGVWLKASADMYHLTQLSQKGSLNVQFTQMCWLGFCKWKTFFKRLILCPTSELVSIFLCSKKRQLCQFFCDPRKITHLIFLGFPSLIFKMGATISTLWGCYGEEQKGDFGCTVTAHPNVLLSCFINPNFLLRYLFLIYTKLDKNAVKQYILCEATSICQQMGIYVIMLSLNMVFKSYSTSWVDSPVLTFALQSLTSS